LGSRSTISDWIILDKLAGIILSKVKGCVVDIGIGQSTIVLADHAQKLSIPHYTCDIKNRKCVWARQYGIPHVFEGKSTDFISQFPDTDVALVFIDGEHIYETVVREVEFFLPRLTEGGVLFLHDTYPPKKSWAVEGNGKHCGDVYKVRQVLERRQSLQVFTWSYTARNCGLTMVMNKEPNRPYYRM